MNTGVHTRIGVVVPKLGSIKTTISLSKEAKLRLGWIEFYYSHNNNARLTCRHFGIVHKTFYLYLNRFKNQGLIGLERRSSRPNNVRKPLTPIPVLDIVKKLRKANPELSKYKLAIILKRDYGYNLSPSSIGRIITRYNLFFKAPVKPKCHPYRRTNIIKLRKPKEFKPINPLDLVEVDVKHLPNLSTKRYAFVAIDVVSKQVAIHVASTISSTQGALAWKKAVHKLGLPKAVINDNGSENMGAFSELIASQPLKHYWARPHTPKDKPHVERFIGTLERECLQWGGVALNLADQQAIINEWLIKYHNYRPHQALNYLTPNEFKEKLKDKEVALRY